MAQFGTHTSIAGRGQWASQEDDLKANTGGESSGKEFWNVWEWEPPRDYFTCVG